MPVSNIQLRPLVYRILYAFPGHFFAFRKVRSCVLTGASLSLALFSSSLSLVTETERGLVCRCRCHHGDRMRVQPRFQAYGGPLGARYRKAKDTVIFRNPLKHWA